MARFPFSSTLHKHNHVSFVCMFGFFLSVDYLEVHLWYCVYRVYSLSITEKFYIVLMYTICLSISQLIEICIVYNLGYYL